MAIQVLLSTMHQNNFSILEKMNIRGASIVVNQSDNESACMIENCYWINSIDRGLSKSRNLALKHANEEICILSDDDLIYVPRYQEIIERQFLDNKEYDIIAFQVEGIEACFKKYDDEIKKINFLNVRNISSVEIAFRRESIERNNINFNENFGAGAKFNHGEENIFLYECLKKKLRILYVPIKIAQLHIGKSTWFNGYNKKYFISNGAIFYEISVIMSWIFILRFAIVHYKKYSNTNSFFKAVKYMLIGRALYKKKYK